MKSEFGNHAEKYSSILRCFAAYMWYKSEQEIFKKITLAEAYHDVMQDKDTEYPSDITSLDPQTSLFKAMVTAFRGNNDYPQNLTLAPHEKAEVEREVQVYSTCYIDAFVIFKQCSLLEQVPTMQQTNVQGTDSLAGIFTDEIFEKIQKEIDIVLFICHFNYVRNGRTFNQQDSPPQIPSHSPMIFRNLQRDSCRCYLLLMCIFIRAYLSKAVEDQKKAKFEKGKVAAYVVDKLQKMNFGVSILQNNDFHVYQIGIVL